MAGNGEVLSPVFSSKLSERSEVADLEKKLVKQFSGLDDFKRATSWCDAKQRLLNCEELREQKKLREPGGFRRQHLRQQADDHGISPKDRPEHWDSQLLDPKKKKPFLMLALIEGMQLRSWTDLDTADEMDDLSEILVPKAPESGHKLSNLGGAIAVFKGNCGAIALMLPKAWSHGGILVSTPIYWVMAALATICVAKLIEVRKPGKTYGQTVGEAAGPLGATAVNVSIILLQSGAVVGYFIMVGDLIRQSIFPWMSKTNIILLQLLMYVPLSLIRNVSRLWPVNGLGALLVVSGVTLTMSIVFSKVYSHGLWDEVELFPQDPAGFLTFLGTACYSFEGIGLVLPVYESLAHPEKMVSIYAGVFTFLTCFNTVVAIMGYAAFGDATKTFLVLNLPPGFRGTYIRAAYALTMICTFPLQLLPAMRLVENMFFDVVKNPPLARKMKKNLFRTVYVIFLSVVAMVGSTSLDHFISLIGAFCGIPLAFIFPTICHAVLVKDLTFMQKALNYFCISLGLVLTVIISVANLTAWYKGE